MISFENVSVRFKRDKSEFTAVDDVSLRIAKGRFYGIVGPSGAGKSTLVRTVNLLQRPTSGKVFINNQDITSYKDKDLQQLRLNIGMIFQHFNLIKNASIFANIAFALQASNTPKEKINQKVYELLDLVGLESKAQLFPNQLSGGQKQRVAIARALANHPQILLCDEATSALDPDNTKEVVQALKRIKETYPITVLFITHQMEVAKNLFDEIAVMEKGKVVEVGTSYDIFSHPKALSTRNLINHSLDGVIPTEVLEHEKDLYLITYKENCAYESLISYLSRTFNLDISIIAGNIEYIQNKPLGRLLISLTGGNSQDKEKALAVIKEKAYVHKFDKELTHYE
ncbi:MAG: ATP-binding cassette domain-containing protein [Succinatimonas sp.]|nr:ATP-binding cassette domain-containing protein [Succinatimonas sp.]